MEHIYSVLIESAAKIAHHDGTAVRKFILDLFLTIVFNLISKQLQKSSSELYPTLCHLIWFITNSRILFAYVDHSEDDCSKREHLEVNKSK